VTALLILLHVSDDVTVKKWSMGIAMLCIISLAASLC